MTPLSATTSRFGRYRCSACADLHARPSVLDIGLRKRRSPLCRKCADVYLAEAHTPGDALVEYEPSKARHGARWLVLVCPFCLRRHRHAAGELDEDPRTQLGRQVAPCRREGGRIYNLICLDLDILVSTNRRGKLGGSA